MGDTKHHRHCLPILFIFLLLIPPSLSATFQDDVTTMQKLAKLLTPAPKSWSTTTDPCTTDWQGVKCSGSRVTGINLASQSISGSLPSDFNKLTELVTLSLQKNLLSGALPSLANLGKLQQIYLDSNGFTSIPDTFFSGLPSLQTVSLKDNPLSPWTIPNDLAQCNNLNAFYASNCSIIGSIPDFFGQLPSLSNLSLSYNNLNGSLPVSFTSSGIQFLWLNNQQSATKLVGPIDVIGKMNQLKQLWIHVNAFSGPIPDLSNSTSLFDLQLRDNDLTGVLPPSILSLSALVDVSLGNNFLQGPFPSFPSTVTVDKSIGNNNFCNDNPGDCDPRVTTLLEVESGLGYPEILAKEWKGNDPCGPAWQFVSCDPQGNVTVLSLANHQLVGTISPAIANLTGLKTLMLNNNNLTGSIPDGLATLPQLQTVDLSNNNLTGKVPAFSESVKLSLSGNPFLGSNSTAGRGGSGSDTGGGSGGAVSPSGSPDGKSKSSNSVVKILVGVIAAVVVLIVCSVCFVCWRKRQKSQQEISSQNAAEMLKSAPTDLKGNGVLVSEQNSLNSSGHSNAHVFEVGSMFISINDLRIATDNFSEHKIIGKGGFGVVYKGVLHDGTQIAVKRMESSAISKKGTREFEAEIAVLTKVRHRHLVGLKGYCTDGNEKLLVYEYMPQGTLGQHLFRPEQHGYSPLSWKQRLTIALDVARGIEYLHSLAQQIFIHRDLKPSNILLGDDMRAKVSDFGLVKLAEDGKFSIETRLAGTFGYLAPEYAATGKLTTKADVYSFGVILMEMITGREVLVDDVNEDVINLVPWFRRNLINKDNIRKIIDPQLELDEETYDSILKVAELAGHCTAREFVQRPGMAHVVNILSPLVEQWKPTSHAVEYDFEPEMDLARVVQRWQANEGTSMMGTSMMGTWTTSEGNSGSSISTEAPAYPRSLRQPGVSGR